MKFYKIIIILIISVLFLSACNHASFKEESKAASKVAKTSFHEKEKKPNKKSGNIHFYLPNSYDLKEESANNIILVNNSITYILFVNPQEDKTSDVVYKSTVEQYKDLEINEKFTDNNKLGFLVIKKLDDDMNEMTTGIGGTKITTQVETSDLSEAAKVMMQIAASVKIEK